LMKLRRENDILAVRPSQITAGRSDAAAGESRAQDRCARYSSS
jgi:hypothetical protein